MNRRHLLLGTLALAATPARAQPQKPQGLDAAQFGVRAHANGEQTQQLQRAIDRAAQAQQPLWLARRVFYRSGPLTLRAGSRIIGAAARASRWRAGRRCWSRRTRMRSR